MIMIIITKMISTGDNASLRYLIMRPASYLEHNPTVLILDGNSFRDAHLRRKSLLFDLFKAFD